MLIKKSSDSSDRPVTAKWESRPNVISISEPLGVFPKLQINLLADRQLLGNTTKKNFEKILIFVGAREGELELVLGL